jgi:rRNA processing protein Gar1
MPKFKTNVTTTDTAHIGDHVVRVFGVMCCPHCLVRLHASAMRDVGEGEYAWICARCHSDVLTISR